MAQPRHNQGYNYGSQSDPPATSSQYQSRSTPPMINEDLSLRSSNSGPFYNNPATHSNTQTSASVAGRSNSFAQDSQFNYRPGDPPSHPRTTTQFSSTQPNIPINQSMGPVAKSDVSRGPPRIKPGSNPIIEQSDSFSSQYNSPTPDFRSQSSNDQGTPMRRPTRAYDQQPAAEIQQSGSLLSQPQIPPDRSLQNYGPLSTASQHPSYLGPQYSFANVEPSDPPPSQQHVPASEPRNNSNVSASQLLRGGSIYQQSTSKSIEKPGSQLHSVPESQSQLNYNATVQPDLADSDTRRSPTPGSDNPSGMFSKITKAIKGGMGRNTPSQGAEESRRGFFRGKNQTRAVAVTTDELSEEDIIIAVMGPTGSGKSSFINMATGGDKGVGHNLASCTTEISITKFHCPDRSDLDVLFVDTPGFDDTNKTDVEILNMIAEWLKVTYDRKIKLSGILYFHRISDNRMAGSPLKNLRMFEKLCGKNALQNIILATTMWDEVDDNVGSQREKELMARYWKGMMAQGSKTVRYKNSATSAWDIIDHFLQVANVRYAVLLQEEMVDMEKQLRETKAGQALYGTLEILVKKQQDMLNKIRAETRRHADDAVLSALKEEYEDLRKQLQVTYDEMQTLKIPLGRRLLRILRRPWDLWEGDNVDDSTRGRVRTRFVKPWGR